MNDLGQGRSKSNWTSSIAGLVLLDATSKPIYFNVEAMRILTYPRILAKVEDLARFLPVEFRSVLAVPKSAAAAPPASFRSGRRRYLCRPFSLLRNSRHTSFDVTALLLERCEQRSADVAAAIARFRLTLREQQTVRFLIDGLTSKEIASRMNVSPNTVKTFVRLIMNKMAVPTRSGIVGKFLGV